MNDWIWTYHPEYMQFSEGYTTIMNGVSFQIVRQHNGNWKASTNMGHKSWFVPIATDYKQASLASSIEADLQVPTSDYAKELCVRYYRLAVLQ